MVDTWIFVLYLRIRVSRGDGTGCERLLRAHLFDRLLHVLVVWCVAFFGLVLIFHGASVRVAVRVLTRHLCIDKKALTVFVVILLPIASQIHKVESENRGVEIARRLG